MLCFFFFFFFSIFGYTESSLQCSCVFCSQGLGAILLGVHASHCGGFSYRLNTRSRHASSYGAQASVVALDPRSITTGPGAVAPSLSAGHRTTVRAECVGYAPLY